jgi:PAS domain S-box-containing protein
MIGYWDNKLRNRYGNRAYSSWFNISPMHMLGMHIQEVIGEERYRLYLPYIEGALRGEPQEFERTFASSDGKGLGYSLVKYIPDTVDGEVRGFFAIVTDMSDIRSVETELKRSETKFRTLYDSSGDAVMLLDENGFFDCNQATLDMFGCASKEEFCAYHPANLSPPTQPGGTDSMILASEKIASAMVTGSNHFAWTHKRADTGMAFAAEVRLTAMELDGRRVLQAIVRDQSLP